MSTVEGRALIMAIGITEEEPPRPAIEITEEDGELVALIPMSPEDARRRGRALLLAADRAEGKRAS